MFACDESADGRVLVFQRRGATTGWDLWVADPDDLQSAAVLVQTPADERNAQLSRDGKWFAYESNASGSYEIFMRSLSAAGTRVQVSGAGGSQVRWRADGRELFYVAADGLLMAAAVTPGEGAKAPELGAPVPLFAAQLGTVPSAVAGAQYVVARDGQRFLVNVFGHDERQTPIRWISTGSPDRLRDAYRAAFSARAGREAPVEPGPRRLPLPGDRRTGERQRGANLMLRQTAEISQFDHAGLPGVEARKLVERSIQQEHFTVGRR